MNIITQKILTTLFLLICFLHSSCGSGSLKIDRTAGVESTSAANTITPETETAAAYFTNEIFVLLSRSAETGGCATANECHLKTSPFSSEQTFFKVDTTSPSETWNWAQVRRNRTIAGNYLTASPPFRGKTLKTQKDSVHNSFSKWSSEEKTKLDHWTELAQ